MNKYQKWLIMSIVFLVAALIMPIYALYTALGETLRTAANTIPNYDANNPATGGIDAFVQGQQAAQAELLVIVIALEILLVACFTATFWYAIKCRDQCRNYPSPTQT
jgi:hypothetical protein